MAISITSVHCLCNCFQLILILINILPSLSTAFDLDTLRTDLTSPTVDCGEKREVSLHQAVFIESPNFSVKKKYPNSVLCKWHFHLNQCILAISCPNFSLNKFLCFDYLEVSDGIGTTKRFCGDEGPQTLYMQWNVSVTFRSSPSFSAAGFRCFAVCLEPGPVTHTDLVPPSIPFASLGHCVCGRGSRERKFALRENFPWMVKLFRKDDHKLFCTASLVTNQYMVSASHCFVSSGGTNDPANIYAVLQDEEEEGKEMRRDVSGIIPYRNQGFTYEVDPDVALVKLETLVNFEGPLKPVCLPKGDDLARQFVGSEMVSSQWEWDDQWQGHHLSNVKSRVISTENCSSLFGNTGGFRGIGDAHGVSPTSIFCAQSSLRGPISGAALLTAENKGRVSKFTQIGVGTWGSDCGQAGRRYRRNISQMYTKLTELTSWILRNTQDSALCKG